MVFSGVEEAGRDNGNGGYVTGGDLSVIGTSTDVDDMSSDTNATLGETETGTQEETRDASLQGPDRVLIRCEGVAPTLPARDLTRAEGSIPPGLQGVTLT